MDPLVTIAIPTYNRVKLLGEALESAFAQTHRNIEILVADDASADETPKFLASIADPRLRFIRQELNVGMVSNLNTLVKEARGEYYALLSDDDSIAPTFVEEHLKAFLGTPDAAFVCSLPTYFDGHFYTPRAASLASIEDGHEVILSYFGRRFSMLSCAALYRTEDIRSFGGYSAQRPCMHDAYVWMQLALRRKVVHIPRYLSIYRTHAATLTSQSSSEPLHADAIKLVVDIARDAAHMGYPPRYVTELLEAGVRWCRRRLTTQLIRQVQAGASKSSLARQIYGLRHEIRADWTFSAPLALAVLLLPYRLISWLRSWYFGLAHRLHGPPESFAHPRSGKGIL